MSEPAWNEGCEARGLKPGEECPDCLGQRALFGYQLINGKWVKP